MPARLSSFRGRKGPARPTLCSVTSDSRRPPPRRPTAHAANGSGEVVGEHFVIRYQPGKDAVLIPYAQATLETARDKVGELLGWRPDARIVIEFYPSASTLAEVSTLTKEEIKAS